LGFESKPSGNPAQDSVLVDPVHPAASENSAPARDHVLLSALNVTASPNDSFETLAEAVSSKPNGLKRLQHRPQQMPWKNLPHTHWYDPFETGIVLHSSLFYAKSCQIFYVHFFQQYT
jgi:hypothetical protein